MPRHLIPILIFALSSGLCLAQGGPPLITDDPGTPGNGHWEINIAGILTSEPTQTVVSIPYFDINYGLGDHLQLKLETGWTLLSQESTGLISGAGNALAGVKWRFLDQDSSGVSVSTYPQLGFHDFLSSSNPDIASGGTQLLLPIELSKEFGTYAFNPEVGYLLSSNEPGAWIYGLVLDYEPHENLEFLAEFHATTRVDGSGTEMFLNAGTRVPLTPGMSLLFAAGHTVSEFVGEPTQLLVYLGAQLRI